MLTTEQKRFYEDNGYIVVRGLLSPDEAAAYRKEAHALAERLQNFGSIDATWGSAKDNAKKTVILHCHDVQFQSAAFTRLLVDDRLTSAAADIIGPNVQLHHNKMFIKPPENGSPFPLHQDAPFFPHERHSMIAAIIHFDDAPIERGCLRVVPGSHKLGLLPHQSEGLWHLPTNKYPIESATPIPAEAGDVLFFSYLTIHGSGINTSDKARTTLLVQMRAPDDPWTIRTHESRGQGMMLRGVDPNCGHILPPAGDRNPYDETGDAVPVTMGGGMMMGG